MKARTTALFFAAAVLLQLGISVGTIFQHEQILRKGELIKLKTAPVDPYDAFRGRYVRLGFAPWNNVEIKDYVLQRPERWFFVRLTNDVEGFACPVDATVRQPSTGLYLRVEGREVYGKTLSVRVPFDRFYMAESKAPKAEVRYRASNSGTNRIAYVTVRVLNGLGVIEDLVLPDLPP